MEKQFLHSNIVKKKEQRIVLTYRISNQYLIQEEYDVREWVMGLEFHESDLHILHHSDGIIRKSSNIISMELKFRENRYTTQNNFILCIFLIVISV